MGQFTLDLKRFSDKAKGRMDLVVRKITLDIHARVTLKTPVDTGRARANWIATIARPATGVREPAASGYGGSTGAANAQASIQQAVASLASSKAGQSLFVVNNLPYIIDLENGSSKQAPVGMLRVTLREYPGVVEKSVRQTRQEIR